MKKKTDHRIEERFSEEDEIDEDLRRDEFRKKDGSYDRRKVAPRML